MAGAAMAQAIDNIFSPFPCRGRGRINLGCRFRQIKPVPKYQPGANVEGKDQLVWRRGLPHRLETVQESKQIVCIAACQTAEINIRKGGIEMMPVRRNAVVHGAVKLVRRPVTDPRLFVRCDVGGIDRPELCLKWQSAGIGGTVSPGMAARTVAQN